MVVPTQLLAERRQETLTTKFEEYFTAGIVSKVGLYTACHSTKVVPQAATIPVSVLSKWATKPAEWATTVAPDNSKGWVVIPVRLVATSIITFEFGRVLRGTS